MQLHLRSLSGQASQFRCSINKLLACSTVLGRSKLEHGTFTDNFTQLVAHALDRCHHLLPFCRQTSLAGVYGLICHVRHSLLLQLLALCRC